VVLDATMMQHETLKYHPLVNTRLPRSPARTWCGSWSKPAYPPQIAAVAVSGADLPRT
jgi:hypothetical protein